MTKVRVNELSTEAPERMPISDDHPGQQMSVRTLGLAVYRNRRVVLWCMMLCWLGAFVAVLVTPETFSATTQVLLEPLPRRPIAVASDGVADPLDSAQADSRMQVVKSERLLRFVFDAVHWPKIEAATNREIKDNFVLSNLRSVRSLFVTSHESQDALDTQMFLRFMDSVSVRRIGLSYVIEITFQARTPKMAAYMANSVTAAYLRNLVLSSQMDGELLERRVSNILSEAQSLLDGVHKGIVPEGNFPDANARVISAAITPISHTSPKTGLIFLLATAFGVGIGLFTSVIRFQRDRLLRSGADVRTLTALDQLAVFDHAQGGAARSTNKMFAFWPEVFSSGSAQPLIAHILQAGNQARYRTIGFVGCRTGAGSSSIALAAARAVSSSGCRATLVDADFHSLGLSYSFDLLGTSGLSDAITSERSQSDKGVASVDLEHIRFVPKGSDRSGSCLVGSPALGQALKRLSEDGPVLVDLPAMERSLDADVIAAHLDAVVIVVARDATTIDDLRGTLGRLPRDKVVGFALNQPAVAKHSRTFRDYLDRAQRLASFVKLPPRLRPGLHPTFRDISKR